MDERASQDMKFSGSLEQGGITMSPVNYNNIQFGCLGVWICMCNRKDRAVAKNNSLKMQSLIGYSYNSDTATKIYGLETIQKSERGKLVMLSVNICIFCYKTIS